MHKGKVLFKHPPVYGCILTLIVPTQKVSDFPVPNRDVTSQTLPGLVSDIPAGDGKIANLFNSVLLASALPRIFPLPAHPFHLKMHAVRQSNMEISRGCP
jgi:hypothetical protein